MINKININTNKWYLRDTYNIKFVTETEGYTACGKTVIISNNQIKVLNGEVWQTIKL